MSVQIAPTAIDRSIARQCPVLSQRQSLRSGTPAAADSSARWPTGIAPGARQRPLPDEGIDGAEVSLRLVKMLVGAPRRAACNTDLSLVSDREPATAKALRLKIKGTSARPCSAA